MVVTLGIPRASAKMKGIIAASLIVLFLNPTARSNENFNVSVTANSSMFCVDLPMHDSNLTFCGISTKWEPRINKIGGIFACVIPTLMSWTLTVLVIVKLRKKIKETFNGMSNVYGQRLHWLSIILRKTDMGCNRYYIRFISLLPT